jgi:hypothetical protein
LPPPEAAIVPPAEVASKPTDSPAKSAGGKARSRKPQRGEAGDPFETRETRSSADKQGKARGFAPQPDLFRRNDTGKPASPLQPKAKRTIIKEL